MFVAGPDSRCCADHLGLIGYLSHMMHVPVLWTKGYNSLCGVLKFTLKG